VEDHLSRYTALVDGKAGAYGVVFPELEGCVAMGVTVDEALTNAAEAPRAWVEVDEEGARHAATPQPLEKLRRRRDVTEALADGAVLATVPLVRETGRPAKANLSIDSGILAAIERRPRAASSRARRSSNFWRATHF
jgi:predicted RNase H-like HicB family nuclease